jgi:hypothetical protein
MGFLFSSSVFPPNAKPETGTQEHSRQEGAKATTDERIADYTWWLAVLTGGLVFVAIGQGVFIARSDKTARIAANAADLSARAAVALELPLIRAEPVGFGLGITQNAAGERFEHFGLQCFEFSNRGRTKAFPIELNWGWIVSDKLPDIPEYRLSKLFDLKATISEVEGITLLYVREFDMELTEGDTERITDRSPAAQVKLWLYCHLVYEDFMDERRSIGFCWKRLDQFGGGRFVADATPAYNRKT